MNLNSHIEQIKDLVPGQMTLENQSLLLNTVEMVFNLTKEQQLEIQALKDEINWLKGEDGKPDIKGKNQKEKDNVAKNISSEKERKKGKRKKKRISKFDSSKRIDKTVIVNITDKRELPSDAVFKGYAKSYYQDLEIEAKLIQVKRAIYYSATTNKTYTAALPNNYQGGDYTQNLKAHIIMLKFEFGMSIPKIEIFLQMSGINIGIGTISNILLDNGALLKEESLLIHQNGVEAGLYVQTDTTSARVNGENYNSHIFCNPYFVSYFTTAHKDRETVLDLLRSNEPRIYALNELTFSIYNYLKLPAKIQEKLLPIGFDLPTDEVGFINKLSVALSSEEIEQYKKKLFEGAYLAAYQSGKQLGILVCDDAPQYKLLALYIVLCWIHVGRHLKKLNPTLTHHKELLSGLLDDFWGYYHQLIAYQKAPTAILEKQLSADFDRIFSKETSYEQLDDRIKKIKSKKDELLVVLKHPYVPLHNNSSELAARKEVRYRDTSFQTRNIRGTQAKDVFFTIIQTCKKLGVNAYAYMLDKLNNGGQMMPLNELVLLKAKG
jgi:hypothetical protein